MPSLELLNQLCPLQAVPGCPEIKVRQAADVYQLWEAWEKEAGMICSVPHWAVVWPAAQLLARYILDHPKWVRGKDVLEIGCGGAVASISAKLSGALLATANDIDPIIIDIAEENALANQVELSFDGTNRIETKTTPDAQLILLADFFYLKSDSLILTEQLREWKKQSIEILIADGGRSFVPGEYSRLLHEENLVVDQDLEGKNKRHVRILKF
jgi:predicted nicotinamide N-methyase